MQLDIRAFELEHLLDRAPEEIEVLSLDCFDTLIWRNTHAPVDVFAELELAGGGMGPRIWAEATARRRALADRGAREIGLAEVYRCLRPSASEADVAAEVARELAQEADHAFAFAPAVALIRAARQRGLAVILVSDMYLSQAQLRAHVAGAAGAELLDMIDHVFVSAEHGAGKRDGLFAHVLSVLGVAPDKVLHVGDNRAADLIAATRHGLHAAHLRQFDPVCDARLRMEAVAAVMLDPAARGVRPVCQAHRAQLALRRDAGPAFALGHDVIGPVMHSFALWLKGELDALAETHGRKVRPLFVMRDGYLPFRVFDALFPDAGARTVEISRFVAFRASISDAATLDYYLAEWLHRLPLRALARQLMMFEHEYGRFLKGDEDEQRRKFARAVRAPDLQRKIIARCRAFTDKLIAHLGGAGVAAGDAVMLVDIGYNGTVQNILAPVLRDRMGLTVAGRYLFLREAQISGLDKRGMLDVRTHDCRALHALSTSVVVIEQLCNLEQGSTVDFTAAGEPIREKVDAKAAHSATRDAVQKACLRFVAEAGMGVARAPASDTLEARCRAAAASLARLFFLPDADEVALFERFDYDVNMGSALNDQMLDVEGGRRGLRRQGMVFYSDRPRGFLSAEIHAQGLPTSLAMFAAARFGLDLRESDFQVGGIEVPVIVATATDHAARSFTAWPTAEGFYRLSIPVGEQRPTLGIQLGRLCEWVQLEELSYTPLADLGPNARQRRMTTAPSIPDAMEEIGPDLYRAQPNGLLFVPPPAMTEPVLLSLVFRPIRPRDAAVAVRAAA